MAKASKAKSATMVAMNAETESSVPRLFTIEEILQEINKMVDPKLQIITSALELAANASGRTGMFYILKALNFEEVPQEDGVMKYVQKLPKQKND